MKLTGKPLDPRRRTPARPYANKRNREPSVTTVLDSLPKSALMWGAANEVAAYCIDFPERIADLARDEAYDKARKSFRGLWDGRAAMGTLTHACNEAWSWGEEFDLAAAVGEMANREKKAVQIWRGREDYIVAEAAGYIDGLERFWRDYEPDTVATEEVVREPGAYIGQRDWTVRLAGLDGVSLLDMKTTAKQDEGTGLYPDSWRLQGAAYRLASEIVEYDDEGKEIATHPNYPTARFCVLHLRGDGDYCLYELKAGGAELERFRQVLGVHHWMQKESKTPEPLALNVPGLERSLEAAL